MAPENPSTPDPESPTSPSVGFNTDQLPHTHTSHASQDDEASVDPDIVRDDIEEQPEEEEEDGEDLYNDNFLELVFSFYFLPFFISWKTLIHSALTTFRCLGEWTVIIREWMRLTSSNRSGWTTRWKTTEILIRSCKIEGLRRLNSRRAMVALPIVTSFPSFSTTRVMFPFYLFPNCSELVAPN